MGKMGAAVEKLKEADVKAKAEEEHATGPEMPVVETIRDAEDALLEALAGDMEPEKPLGDASLADITKAEEESLLAYLQDDAEVNPYAGIEEEVYAI